MTNSPSQRSFTCLKHVGICLTNLAHSDGVISLKQFDLWIMDGLKALEGIYALLMTLGLTGSVGTVLDEEACIWMCCTPSDSFWSAQFSALLGLTLVQRKSSHFKLAPVVTEIRRIMDIEFKMIGGLCLWQCYRLIGFRIESNFISIVLLA